MHSEQRAEARIAEEFRLCRLELAEHERRAQLAIAARIIAANTPKQPPQEEWRRRI